MSRVGKKPISIPAGVSITLGASEVKVKGPKGELTLAVPSTCKVTQENNEIVVTRESEEKFVRASHGTTRAHLNNMVQGVTVGFTKDLEIIGVGYKAEAKGTSITLTIGYSHLVHFTAPQGITIETPEPTKIKISGIDRQKVGQVAAEIRGIRPPEPYKGKGIKYIDEHIERKAGKSAVGSGG
ncbi:MAG TPA: 50S ribosomal protein L6 [Candidatus Krumholzibacteria bacterium]|jgi:large subunit ribosomal protein L6|nr:50S ribosomal protein L6 [Candidatus Krumholzibacteria bacterium]